MRKWNWRWKCGLCTTKSEDSEFPKPRRLCKWVRIRHWHELPLRPRFPSGGERKGFFRRYSSDYWKSLLTRTWWTAWVQNGAIVKFRSPISASIWRLREPRSPDKAAFNFWICFSCTSWSYWIEITPRLEPFLRKVLNNKIQFFSRKTIWSNLPFINLNFWMMMQFGPHVLLQSLKKLKRNQKIAKITILVSLQCLKITKMSHFQFWH